MTQSRTTTGTASLHITLDDKQLHLTPAGFTHVTQSLQALLTIGTSHNVGMRDTDIAAIANRLEAATNMTDQFLLTRLRYGSAFEIVFASVMGTMTSAAFAVATLYNRVQDLRVKKTQTDIQVEINRQVLRELQLTNMQEESLRRPVRDQSIEAKRIRVINTVSRAGEILAKADDIHVEQQ